MNSLTLMIESIVFIVCSPFLIVRWTTTGFVQCDAHENIENTDDDDWNHENKKGGYSHVIQHRLPILSTNGTDPTIEDFNGEITNLSGHTNEHSSKKKGNMECQGVLSASLLPAVNE